MSVSQLYRTAKAEIARKDRRILELTQKLDSVVFRRRNNNRNPLEDGKNILSSQLINVYFARVCLVSNSRLQRGISFCISIIIQEAFL